MHGLLRLETVLIPSTIYDRMQSQCASGCQFVRHLVIQQKWRKHNKHQDVIPNGATAGCLHTLTIWSYADGWLWRCLSSHQWEKSSARNWAPFCVDKKMHGHAFGLCWLKRDWTLNPLKAIFNKWPKYTTTEFLSSFNITPTLVPLLIRRSRDREKADHFCVISFQKLTEAYSPQQS